MNREHASKGYAVYADTDTHEINFYGITILADAVINAVLAPTAGSPEGEGYNGDEAGIAGKTLIAGLYLPIRGSSIDLTSGTVIVWIE